MPQTNMDIGSNVAQQGDIGKFESLTGEEY